MSLSALPISNCNIHHFQKIGGSKVTRRKSEEGLVGSGEIVIAERSRNCLIHGGNDGGNCVSGHKKGVRKYILTP